MIPKFVLKLVILSDAKDLNRSAVAEPKYSQADFRISGFHAS